MSLELFQIIIGFTILRDRLQNFNKKSYREDPWSVIAMIILASEVVSLFAIFSRDFLQAAFKFTPSEWIFSYLNCFAVLLRYFLIQLQLIKLKNHIIYDKSAN